MLSWYRQELTFGKRRLLRTVFNLRPLNPSRQSAFPLYDPQLLNQCLFENNLCTKLLLLILFNKFATESIFINVLVVTLLSCDPKQPYSIRLSGPTLETGLSTEVGTKSPAHVKAQPYTLAGAFRCRPPYN